MEERNAWLQLSMEMDCPIPASQENQSLASVFDNVEPEPSKCDLSYWVGKYSRSGADLLQREDVNELNKYIAVQNPVAYMYDPNNDAEGPFAETCVAANSFKETFDAYKREGKTLTPIDIIKLLDGIKPPNGPNYCEIIVKLFSQVFEPYTLVASPAQQNYYDAIAGFPSFASRILELNTTHADPSYSSGLFQCIDYCLDGGYQFVPGACFNDDYEFIVRANVNLIKSKFVDAILHHLNQFSTDSSSVPNNNDDQQRQAKALMSSVFEGQHYDRYYARHLSKMEQGVFVSHVIAEDHQLGLSESELCKMHQEGTFIINITCHESLFRHWMSSSDAAKMPTREQFELARANGATGFLLPPGYLNKWTEGGEYELSLIPQLFGRSVILIDLDKPMPEAGVALRCARTHAPAYVASGKPLSVLTALTVHATTASNALLIQSADTLGSQTTGPIILMRCNGRFSVHTPSDGGKRLANVLKVAAVYRRVALIHSTRKNYMQKIFESCPDYDPTDMYDPTLLIKLIQKHLKYHQKLIISFLSYELSIYQFTFCKLFVRLPVHNDPEYVRSIEVHVRHLSNVCKFNNPLEVIDARFRAQQ